MIRLHHDAEAADLGNDSAAVVVTSADGRKWAADVVIGADGVHSTIRRFVDATHPSARYAGYVLWRAMVSEEDLAGTPDLPGPTEPSRELFADRYRLVTYLVPGPTGDVRVGHRPLNLVWYDPAREDLLRSRGLLTGDVVLGSLSAGDLPEELSSELRGIAEQTWPSPWNEALGHALDRRLVFGTPVAEYLPQVLVTGRVALVGDAAHAATPMVGGGFRQGLYDAAQLAAALHSAADVPSMLGSYQAARLEPAVQHVLNSIRASRTHLKWARVS